MKVKCHSHLKNAASLFKHIACISFVMHRRLVRTKQWTHAFVNHSTHTAQEDWNPAQHCLNFLDKTSSEILPQWRRWLWVKYSWAMIRAEKFWNVWVKEVTLVHSPFPPRSALFSTVQCANLFWESCSEWFICSFSITERLSQTGLMLILFLQSKTHLDFPFGRAKRNKGGKQKSSMQLGGLEVHCLRKYRIK